MPSPRLASLRHPGWWCALAVLVLNDHVLKRALPSALTGKLSDVAGLIVAPVLVAALFGARTRRGRVLAFVACALPFAAINLSPPVAARWDALVGWSTTTDPTDLWTLLVAPIALHIAAYEPATRSELVPRFGALLGGLACIATAPPPGEPIETTEGGPLLQNRLDEEVTVRVRWIDASNDCERLGEWIAMGDADIVARALDPDLFDVARTYRLAPDESADLSRPVPTGAARPRCDALILGADGIEPQLIAYYVTDGWTTPATLALTSEPDEAIRLTTTGGAYVRARPAPSIAPASCEPAADAGVFAWDGRVPLDAVVQGYEPLSDGCFILQLSDQRDVVETGEGTGDPTDPPRLEPLPPELFELTVCAPRELFDFAIGEELTASVRTDRLALSGERQGVWLERLSPRPTVWSEPLCEGERLPCGAYVEPIGWDGLRPGEPEVRESATQTTTRLLDDAIHVVAAHEDCGLEPGLRGVLLTHWENHE